MKAYKVSVDALRLDERSAYNPQTWNLNIDRMLKYNDVIFYKVDKGDGYEYDRHFCEYTLPEGLRLFASFDYSGGISNGGFYRLDIEPITNDGRTNAAFFNLVNDGKIDEAKQLMSDLSKSNFVEITIGNMYNEKGEKVVIGTTQTARQWMVERSKKFNMTFTKGF